MGTRGTRADMMKDSIHDYQTANVIDNLRYCCDIMEPDGLYHGT